MAEEFWYFLDGDLQRGPFSLEQIQQLLTTHPDVLVWHQGMKDWIPAGLMPELLSQANVSPANGQLNYFSPGPAIDPRYFHPADFWLRFIAIFLDWIILGLPMSAANAFFSPAPVFIPGPLRLPPMTFIFNSCGSPFFWTIASWLYFALMESSIYQGTPGKMVMGLKVVDLAGQRISFSRATGRFFAKTLSVATLYIGFMMAGWTQYKQALHDKVANTLVVTK